MPVSAVISGFERPVFIDYREPRWLGVMRIMMPVSAVTAVLFTALGLPVKLILVLVILIYGLTRLKKQYGDLKQGVVVQLVLNHRDEWRVISGGNEEDASLSFASIPVPGIIFLQLTSRSKQCFNLVITGHCLDPESMRRLRVRLRYRLKHTG